MIRLTNVGKDFRKQRVLDGVNLEIAAGERIALIGSNGAGKTTLIRCLLGEYTHQGEVTIGGLAPRGERTQVLGKVGFVPQLPPPLKMPVGQLLAFAAAVCATDAERMHALARRLGLDVGGILARPFNRLSGGMKQKLLIAIALGRDSELLVMDEPAANLDPEARHIFFSLLAERLGSTTMIISSHRLDEVAPLVNRVIEMDTGRIVLDDRVAEESRLSTLFEVHLTLARADAAIARTLGSWQFADRRAGVEWHGTVSGADRLRFFGMVARYVGLLSRIEMHEVDAAVALQ
ncbi:ABC transporter ATP-binding protein [Accumulibacter sp.]|uniref:ABC transporter ATP-binding protein n=1 Tax=Accumulibacter sp. TaxID=2053492 RepID=UPI0025E39C27|nr:ABC transporter ATP-binding protein [Accumulibacter sp.]MCM8612747.1 ABC transporter ATP-binding protein [Accumulibacter sp.]MCM8637653.1 ABC transporter ATP-binding protein [Accumulibacter sp.]MCM8639680.1 ABC transporter ATP-binding protein [Accumulibacter sp.]